VAELLRLQDEYAAWLDCLPDSLKESATEALRTIIDLDELAAVEPASASSSLSFAGVVFAGTISHNGCNPSQRLAQRSKSGFQR
jgi:hypothetical protein